MRLPELQASRHLLVLRRSTTAATATATAQAEGHGLAGRKAEVIAPVWLLTVVVLSPFHSERHPTVEFPWDACWRKGLEVFAEEAQRGVVAGFHCDRKPLP